MSPALAILRAHPRHLVLGALVAGLLAGPAGFALAGALAALAAVLAGRPWLALLAAAAVLAGTGIAEARLHAIDATALRPLLGHDVRLRATALDRPRTTASGARSVHVRLRGERVRVRLRDGVRWPAVAPGSHVLVRGTLARLAPFEAFERRRGVHAALELRAAEPTGGRRGGLPGVVDTVRGRAEAGLAAGLSPREAGLLSGMILGEDEAVAEPVRDDFRTSGLAHLQGDQRHLWTRYRRRSDQAHCPETARCGPPPRPGRPHRRRGIRRAAARRRHAHRPGRRRAHPLGRQSFRCARRGAGCAPVGQRWWDGFRGRSDLHRDLQGRR